MTNLMNEKMLELFLICLGKRNEQKKKSRFYSYYFYLFLQIRIFRSSVRDINSRNVGGIMQNDFYLNLFFISLDGFMIKKKYRFLSMLPCNLTKTKERTFEF